MSRATMQVKMNTPTMVFMGGYLLPMGSFQISPSQLAPNMCTVKIAHEHAGLPPDLRSRVAEHLASAENGGALPFDLNVRAIVPMPGGGGNPIMVELQVSGLEFVKTAPPVQQ